MIDCYLIQDEDLFSASLMDKTGSILAAIDRSNVKVKRFDDRNMDGVILENLCWDHR